MKRLLTLIKDIVLIMGGMCIGGYFMAHKYCQKINECRISLNKYQYWVRIYDMWMMTKQSSMDLEKYLLSKGINNVAIYGAFFLGTRLYYELRETHITVKYVFDRNPNVSLIGVDVRNPDSSEYEEVDAVIVTALFTYDDIRKLLVSKGYKQIIGINDILYEMLGQRAVG